MSSSRGQIGKHALIVALHDLHLNSRIVKQAQSLCEAGYRVTLLGIIRQTSDPLVEERPFGRILRVRTTRRLHSEQAPSRVSAGSSRKKGRVTTLIGALRSFLGRMRDNLILARVAARELPDVVVSQDLSVLPAACRVGRKLGIPVVYDMIDIVTTDDAAGARLLIRLWRLVERVLVKCVSRVIAVSPLSAEWAQNELRPSAVVAVVYNGPVRCECAVKPPHEPLRLLFQGHFAPNRRLDELVAAMSLLRGRAILTLQGFGELRSALERQVSELGLEDSVQFIDPCDPEDVVPQAALHDVGIINYPGSTENLRRTVPNKLLDYLAAGLAVVASDLPALRDIVTEHDCGVLFEPRGPEAIAAAVERVLQDIGRLETMKANALRASPQYAWELQGERFVAVVNSVVEQSKETGSGHSRGSKRK